MHINYGGRQFDPKYAKEAKNKQKNNNTKHFFRAAVHIGFGLTMLLASHFVFMYFSTPHILRLLRLTVLPAKSDSDDLFCL